MSDLTRVARNTIFLFAAQIVTIIVGVLSLKLTTTHLGPTEYGVLAFAQSFTGMFGAFMDFGLGTLIIRDVSRDKSKVKKYLGNIIAIKLLLAVIVFAVIVVFINLNSMPAQTVYAVYIIAFSVIFTSLTGVFYSIFQSFEKMEYQSIGTALTSVLILIGAGIAVYQKYDVLGFALSLFIVYLVILVYCIAISSWKFVLPHIEFDWNFLKPTTIEALPFGISAIFGVIFYSISSVMLEYMQGSEAVGFYNAAYKLFIFVLFVPQIFGSALFPVMSKYYVTSKHSLKVAFNKYFKYMAILSLPMGVGTSLLADKIIFTISGGEFTNSIIVLQVLIWAAVFIFLSSAYGFLMNSANMQRTSMKIAGICMVVNIFINFLIIPVYSYIGASVATVATELTSLILSVVVGMMAGYESDTKPIFDLIKAGISSLVMGGYILYFRNQNLIFLVVSSAIVYFATIYLFKGFEKEDIEILKDIAGVNKVIGIIKAK